MNSKSTKIFQLGRNIYKKRRELGYSQNNFAEKIDISREHLAKIETGKRNLSLGLLFKIAETLDIEEKDLFDFSDM